MEEPIDLPIDGVLDLHTFLPKEIGTLINDYIETCLDANILDIRIIHGKGKGILRNQVYAILKKHPLVKSFAQAPPNAGGWGAVVARLEKNVA
ncbi:MAG: Smr/MutS family protein [Desulfomonilaceae bacterium]